MHLNDLLPEESLALVALSRAVARADGAITPLEGQAIAIMAAEIGEATYRKLHQGRRVVSGSSRPQEVSGEHRAARGPLPDLRVHPRAGRLRFDLVTGDVGEREKKLAGWEAALAARLCHPREDHLIPLMVVAGAAGEDVGVVTWRGMFMGSEQVGWHFG